MTNVWVHVDPVIMTLTVDGEQVETTPEHPFFTIEGEWLAVAELQIGDEIRTAEWGSGTIESIHFTVAPQPMYNFTVATAHTYFVGDGQWLVHNSCPTGLRQASAGLRNLFDSGSVNGKSIISIRENLLDDGFTMTLSDNQQGYLFANQLGEEVRIMNRNGGWDIRIKNQFGNYLDEFGNVANPDQTHEIFVESR